MLGVDATSEEWLRATAVGQKRNRACADLNLDSKSPAKPQPPQPAAASADTRQDSRPDVVVGTEQRPTGSSAGSLAQQAATGAPVPEGDDALVTIEDGAQAGAGVGYLSVRCAKPAT